MRCRNAGRPNVMYKTDVTTASLIARSSSSAPRVSSSTSVKAVFVKASIVSINSALMASKQVENVSFNTSVAPWVRSGMRLRFMGSLDFVNTSRMTRLTKWSQTAFAYVSALSRTSEISSSRSLRRPTRDACSGILVLILTLSLACLNSFEGSLRNLSYPSLISAFTLLESSRLGLIPSSQSELSKPCNCTWARPSSLGAHVFCIYSNNMAFSE
mmetsp:Transcript_9264/g.17080  ORF Transcript_9264/g.17080 Transcript_9264/m.17080 type:complete len:214 (+) Transcript_9264:466-1107(+)